ncbi:type IV secretory pathway TrbF-like protein [Leifsonia sp. 1010]|nr:type IV secretory pathway TrbF-like protein [Leifsonia sp. 1010]
MLGRWMGHASQATTDTDYAHPHLNDYIAETAPFERFAAEA